MSDQTRGLYRKYDVRRLGGTPGKHDDCEYFVLDLMHDAVAIHALRTYASACRAQYPDLAADLDKIIGASGPFRPPYAWREDYAYELGRDEARAAAEARERVLREAAQAVLDAAAVDPDGPCDYPELRRALAESPAAAKTDVEPSSLVAEWLTVERLAEAIFAIRRVYWPTGEPALSLAAVALRDALLREGGASPTIREIAAKHGIPVHDNQAEVDWLTRKPMPGDIINPR